MKTFPEIKTMKYAWLILILLFGTGCESLKRITEGAKAHPPENPIVYHNPHVVQGITTVDYQWVEHIPIDNRKITIEVKAPRQTEYRTLNQYEYKLHNGPVPTLEFGKYVEVTKSGLLVIPTPAQPTAPKGTEYIITSKVLP